MPPQGQPFQPNNPQLPEQPPAHSQTSTNQVSPHPDQAQAYDFILNPTKPPGLPLFKGTSFNAMRLAFIAGGLLVLVIIIIVLGNLFGSSTDFSGFVTVVQDQQELVHLATAASQQQNLSSGLQNSVATIEVSIGSSQSQIISYLKSNHFTLSTKTMNLKLNTSLDNELNNASSSGTYDQTLSSALSSQLNTYMSDMATTYNNFTGPKGRGLLHKDYLQAELLVKQLGSASSTSS